MPSCWVLKASRLYKPFYLGNWGTCSVTTRGSIYDTSNYCTRLFGYLFVVYLFHPKQVRERNGRGGSINDLIVTSRPSILFSIPDLARITQS